jgi:hypothetical protein
LITMTPNLTYRTVQGRYNEGSRHEPQQKSSEERQQSTHHQHFEQIPVGSENSTLGLVTGLQCDPPIVTEQSVERTNEPQACRDET